MSRNCCAVSNNAGNTNRSLILNFLRQNSGNYFCFQELSAQLNISVQVIRNHCFNLSQVGLIKEKKIRVITECKKIYHFGVE